MLTDAHAHCGGGSSDVLRLWNVGTPNAKPEGLFSAGIHPKDAATLRLADFDSLFQDARCRAIGECGLDRLAAPPLPLQTEVFLAHAERAEELAKPMLLHCVRCRPELLRIRRKRAPKQPWILHGFRGSERAAFELLDAGLVLSFGAGLLRDAGNVEPWFSRIPDDRILIESDEEPESLERVFALAAQMRGLDAATFRNLVEDNFRRLFHVER